MLPRSLPPHSHRIPGLVDEWLNLVEEYGLHQPDMRLTTIKNQQLRPTASRRPNVPLSGSTMVLDDFLFLRAIWPRPGNQQGILDSGFHLLTELGLIDDASHRAGLQVLGLNDNFDINSRPALTLGTESATIGLAISNQQEQGDLSTTTPTITPRRHGVHASRVPDAPRKANVVGDMEEDEELAGNALPIFHRFIQALSSHSPEHVDERANPHHLGAFFNAYSAFVNVAAEPSRFPSRPRLPRLDLNSSRPRPVTPIGSPSMDPIQDIINLSLQDTPTRQPGKAAAHRTVREAELARETPSPPPNDKPDRTPPDETLITFFAGNFFNTLSSFVQLGSKHHQMQPWRVQFQCSPRGAGLPDAYFNAAVDAIVETKVRIRRLTRQVCCSFC